MFRIDTMTRGRFGNRILQYNTLMQLGSSLKCEASCVPWNSSLPGGASTAEGYNCFAGLIGYKESMLPKVKLNWEDILAVELEQLPRDRDYVLGPYCMHNNFWKVTQKDPRCFLKINEKYKRYLPSDITNVGIHFRGTDKHQSRGGQEIHTPDYYINSIDLVESNFNDITYYLCTDDLSFTSYTKALQYLDKRGLRYELGSPNQFVDFSTLAECEVLISNSSTFVVCAGFLGRKNKKIIHSQDWMNKNIFHIPWSNKKETDYTRRWQLSFDQFWVDLFTGTNEYYNVWRVI